MGINISMNKVKATIKRWRMGEYFRQFSIVAAGVIVTFWGSDWISERARQREVRATMQLVAEELEHNRQELRNIQQLLNVDIHMSNVLMEHKMDISEIPMDTLYKYDKLFNNMNDFYYRTDALDVLKGSSLMQYIPDKRLLQDVMQIYFELGRKQKDVRDYYTTKTDVLMGLVMTSRRKDVLDSNRTFRDEISFLLKHDKFVNFVIMAPGFLYWEEFAALDEKLAHQIQVLKDKYK